MPVESLSCPNCGAPLSPPPSAGPWLCLYCNSLLLMQAEDGASRPSLQSHLDAESVQAVKQLLLSGQRDAALQRFMELSDLNREDAQRAINQLGADLTLDTLFHQQLTPAGLATVILALLLLPASLLAWSLGWLPVWLALPGVGLAAFLLFVYWRGLIITLRYWNAPVAPATTIHFAPIGVYKRGQMQLHTFKVVLEVHPSDGAPFQAQAVIPVRAENVSRVRRGEIIQVKYLPGEPEGILINQA